MSEQLKKLKQLHLYLFSGSALFGMVSYFLQLDAIVRDEQVSKMFFNVAAVVFFVCILGGRYFYRYLIGLVRKAPQRQRFEKYKTALMIKWLLLELTCLVSLVFFLLTAQRPFLLLAALALMLLIADYPTQKRMYFELGIV